jgi:hypothetical protein
MHLRHPYVLAADLQETALLPALHTARPVENRFSILSEKEKKSMKKLTSILLTTVVLTVLLAGCSFTAGVTDKTVTALDNAIAALDRQPTTWKDVLGDTVAELKDAGSSFVPQVQNLLSESLALVTTQGQCNIDIMGIRIKDGLRYIRDHLVKLKADASPPTPWVCVFAPNRLQLKRASTNAPWVLQNPRVVDVYGVNFRFVNLPTVDMLDERNGMAKQSIVQPKLQTPYLIQLDFQRVDFSQIKQGYSFVLLWKESPEQYALSAEFSEPTSPPAPATGSEDFTVKVHADNGGFGGLGGECKNIQDDPAASHWIGSGWKIDRSRGDAGHPGISEIAVDDNDQSKDSLEKGGYNYQAQGDSKVQVEGTICGAGWWGPGAVFARTYRIYLIKL